MLQKFIKPFISFDKIVDENINYLLLRYDLNSVNKDITSITPIFFKLTLYFLILLVPAVILKLIYPTKTIVNFLLKLMVFLIVMSVFGIFIGFFQALYS
jgi:hypothetical protein